MTSVKVQLFNEDSYVFLSTLETNSIDAVLTDPPGGISVLNQKWDDNKGGRDRWISWLSLIFRDVFRVMKPGAYMFCWSFPRTTHWTGMALENAGFYVKDVITHCFGSGVAKTISLSRLIDQRKGIRSVEPVSEEAKEVYGWQTGLRSTHELWYLAQKPFQGSYVDNWEKYGVGCLNIDACRVPFKGNKGSPTATRRKSKKLLTDNKIHIPYRSSNEIFQTDRASEKLGRHPPTVILSHSPDCNTDVENESCALDCPQTLLDYYNAPQAKDYYHCLPSDPIAIDPLVYFANMVGKARYENGLNNIHPTVKSTPLMSYFSLLITPKNGIILDPFMGSGTTGVAAIENKFRFIGVEQDSTYFEIAEQRIYQTLEKLER